ncbi:Major Facilitator Superfamily protein, partial [Arthrobacter subterraneus]
RRTPHPNWRSAPNPNTKNHATTALHHANGLDPDNSRRPEFVLGPFVLRGLIDAVLATITGLASAMAALVVYGLGTSTGAVTFNSLLQAEVPENLRGRIFATFDTLWQSGRLISLLLGGLAADLFGVRVVYYIGAALLFAAAWAGWKGLQTVPPRTES